MAQVVYSDNIENTRQIPMIEAEMVRYVVYWDNESLCIDHTEANGRIVRYKQ